MVCPSLPSLLSRDSNLGSLLMYCAGLARMVVFSFSDVTCMSSIAARISCGRNMNYRLFVTSCLPAHPEDVCVCPGDPLAGHLCAGHGGPGPGLVVVQGLGEEAALGHVEHGVEHEHAPRHPHPHPGVQRSHLSRGQLSNTGDNVLKTNSND